MLKIRIALTGSFIENKGGRTSFTDTSIDATCTAYRAEFTLTRDVEEESRLAFKTVTCITY